LTLAITNPLPKEADICLSQVPEATYGFPSAIRSRHLICPGGVAKGQAKMF
jgi:hypothetical protein